MRFLPLILILVVAACAPRAPTAPTGPLRKEPVTTPAQPVEPLVDPRTAVRNFIAVIERVEPVAEQVCREASSQQNCDFLIVVDENPAAPPNAFQFLDDAGRPVVAFTVSLIAQTRNQDELAFIMSHEAAHHIAGHLQRQQQAAQIGATIFGNLAQLGGDDPTTIENAARVGAQLGARSYSKEFELEADALGARITEAAGYNALRGAEFFFRIPDPGDRFLGTHPANADRIDIVRQVSQRS